MAKKRTRTFDHAKLASLRKEKGFTQSQLGEKCGADNTVISHWETGSAAPRADKLPLVADALGVSIDDLYTVAKAS